MRKRAMIINVTVFNYGNTPYFLATAPGDWALAGQQAPHILGAVERPIHEKADCPPDEAPEDDCRVSCQELAHEEVRVRTTPPPPPGPKSWTFMIVQFGTRPQA